MDSTEPLSCGPPFGSNPKSAEKTPSKLIAECVKEATGTDTISGSGTGAVGSEQFSLKSESSNAELNAKVLIIGRVSLAWLPLRSYIVLVSVTS